MYTHIYKYIYSYRYIYTYISMYIYMYIYTYMYMHTYIHIYIYFLIYSYLCVDVHIYIYMYMYIMCVFDICTYMRMCLCVYVCVGAGRVGQTRAVGFDRYIWSHDTSGAKDDSAFSRRLRWCAQRWAPVTGYLFFPPALFLLRLLPLFPCLSHPRCMRVLVFAAVWLCCQVCVYVCINKYVYVHKDPFSDKPVGVGRNQFLLLDVCVGTYVCIYVYTYIYDICKYT